MNYFKEKKFAFWAITILLVLNLSTLTMIWIHKPPCPLPPPPPFSEKFIPDFVVAELKLDAKQAMEFEVSEQQHIQKIKLLLDSLHQYKQRLFQSAFKNAVDSAKINDLTSRIGSIAQKIDIITFFHVTELKNICNSRQQNILEDIFTDMAKMRRAPPKDAPLPPQP